MTNTLLKEFVDFVNSKPADMEIDHDNGWDCCAVGKFHDSKFPEVDWYEKLNVISKFSGEIFGIDDLLNYDMNSVLGSVYYNLNHSRYDTYGDLAAELNALGV